MYLVKSAIEVMGGELEINENLDGVHFQIAFNSTPIQVKEQVTKFWT